VQSLPTMADVHWMLSVSMGRLAIVARTRMVRDQVSLVLVSSMIQFTCDLRIAQNFGGLIGKHTVKLFYDE
jgi:hypothetical protein